MKDCLKDKKICGEYKLIYLNNGKYINRLFRCLEYV